MNLVLLHEHDYLSSGQVRLTGRRQSHISKVLRKSVGDTLQVGRLGGKIGTGTVLALSDSEVTLDIVTDQDPPPPQSITLLLALPRPKVLKRIVQGVTAMGIKKIILFNTWRVEKSYWQSPLLNEESLREQMILGLEQARDTCLPEIWQRNRFKPFVEDELPKLVTGRRALVAHPNAAVPCPCNKTEPTILAIGPEGGFLPYELNKLSDAGFQTVHLGERALRVETAIPALLGRLLSV
jgi:RsmE family RNA methyltransferase